MLFALNLNAVDFLVTQDRGIHDRVRQSSLSKRVLSLSDAIAWLKQTFEPTEVKLPLVVERKAHEIDTQDPIFDSLRQGYQGFDGWWQRKCVNEHRPCWVVEIERELAGICVRKDEPRSEATVTLPGNRILKLCTFKVKPEFRGEKLGELLLKQALWFAQRNKFDLIYVTTFPDQTFLIQILEFFGFQHTKTDENGEYVYEKPLSRDRLTATQGDDVFAVDRKSYPRFSIAKPVNLFCVPIMGIYHTRLFPEIAVLNPLPLFPGQAIYQRSGDARTPGNTIRKVYLCRAQESRMKAGDLLFFYESKSPGFESSQSITSVGVLEAVSTTSDLEELTQLTAKRSAYSHEELKEELSKSTKPLKVIDFLLVGHLEPPVPLAELVEARIFSRKPPQSIKMLAASALETFKARMQFGFEI